MEPESSNNERTPLVRGEDSQTERMLKRNLLVDILAVAFGVGAWVSVNGVWVELPLLVQELPEGWALPSFMAIVIQIANVGPIVYSLLHLYTRSIKSVPMIYAIIFTGTVASLLLALFWNRTTVVAGSERSTALLLLLLCLSLVDCTSSVLYIPYMAFWKEIYLTSYLIGEGLSGLLPALVALGQGVGGNAKCVNVSHFDNNTGTIIWQIQKKHPEPNFSVETFFYILFGMMLASFLSFILLELFPSIQSERSLLLDPRVAPKHPGPNSEEYQLVTRGANQTLIMKKMTFLLLLGVLAWACLLSNGLLPSIQSFSCGPYGDVPYHLATALSALANPLAAFSSMILPKSSPRFVVVLCALGTMFGVYIFVTAAMSPTPPLVGSLSGSFLIVTVWIAFSGIITFVRVQITNLMRVDGAQPLFWSGVVTQAGSALGAAIAFVLVNEIQIFQYYDPCA